MYQRFYLNNCILLMIMWKYSNTVKLNVFHFYIFFYKLYTLNSKKVSSVFKIGYVENYCLFIFFNINFK
jgi:hypothetical protein